MEIPQKDFLNVVQGTMDNLSDLYVEYYFNIIKLNVILLLFTAIYVCVYQMDVKQIQIVGRRELVITTHPSQIGMIFF